MRPTFLFAVLSFASAVAGCDQGEPQADAALAPVEPWEESALRPHASDELIELNLSDAAVAELSADELWMLGVEHLGWTAARPAGSTKEQIHQLLLQGKYRDVGDFGTPEDTPRGWVSDDQ